MPWTLGLAGNLQFVADPGLDRDGLTLSISADKKRIFIPKAVDNDF